MRALSSASVLLLSLVLVGCGTRSDGDGVLVVGAGDHAGEYELQAVVTGSRTSWLQPTTDASGFSVQLLTKGAGGSGFRKDGYPPYVSGSRKSQDIRLDFGTVPALLGRWEPESVTLYIDSKQDKDGNIEAASTFDGPSYATEEEGLFITRLERAKGASPWQIEGRLVTTLADGTVPIDVEFDLQPTCGGEADSSLVCGFNYGMADGEYEAKRVPDPTGEVERDDETELFAYVAADEPMDLQTTHGFGDPTWAGEGLVVCPLVAVERFTNEVAHGGRVRMAESNVRIDLGGEVQLTCDHKDAAPLGNGDARCYGTDTVDAEGCSWDLQWFGTRVVHTDLSVAEPVRTRSIWAIVQGTSNEGCAVGPHCVAEAAAEFSETLVRIEPATWLPSRTAE